MERFTKAMMALDQYLTRAHLTTIEYTAHTQTWLLQNPATFVLGHVEYELSDNRSTVSWLAQDISTGELQLGENSSFLVKERWASAFCLRQEAERAFRLLLASIL